MAQSGSSHSEEKLSLHTQPDPHLNFDLLWSAVLARQSIMVLSEEVPGCSCVSLAKRGCLKAIMSTSTRLLRLPDWMRTWQGQKSQLKTLEGCVWLLCGQKVMVDFYPLWTMDWINYIKKVEFQQMDTWPKPHILSGLVFEVEDTHECFVWI